VVAVAVLVVAAGLCAGTARAWRLLRARPDVVAGAGGERQVPVQVGTSPRG